MRRLASALGNQAFSRQVLARDRTAGFGRGGTVTTPAPEPKHPHAGFGDNPHAVDPSRVHDDAPEPALAQSTYGPLPFPVKSGIPNRSDLNYFTRHALQADAAAPPEFAALMKRVGGGEGTATGSSPPTTPHWKARSPRHPNEKATQHATDLEQEQGLIELGATAAGLITVELEDARAKLASAQMRLEGIQDVAEARRLADQAAEVKEATEKSLERVKDGMGSREGGGEVRADQGGEGAL